MINVTKLANGKYRVFDHVLNLPTDFKTKAKADDFKAELEAKYEAIKIANENVDNTDSQTTTENVDNTNSQTTTNEIKN